MPSADVYGSKEHDLEKVKVAIESELGVQFAPHESRYRSGEYYMSGNTTSEHFILQRSFDLIDNEPAENNFAEFPVILYVEETERSPQIRKLLEGGGPSLSLLKHEDF